MRGQWPKLVCGKETDAESTMIVHCGSQEMRRWKQKRWNQGCPRRGVWFWRIGVGAPALLEDGRCLRSHKNSGTNKTKMTLHCGPSRPSLSYLGRCLFLIPLFQCPKLTKCSCKRPIAWKSCMFRATDCPCQAPLFSDQLCLGSCSVVYWVGSGVITGCFPRSKLIWEHAWKGQLGPL